MNAELGDDRRLGGFRPPRYRLRAGDWRDVVRQTEGSFRILRVVHRREAYRKSYWIRQAVPESEYEAPDETSQNSARPSARVQEVG